MADEMKRKGVENQIKGLGKEAEGRIRNELGDLTDRPGQQIKGKAQEFKGKAQRKIGEAQSDLGGGEIREEQLLDAQLLLDRQVTAGGSCRDLEERTEDSHFELTAQRQPGALAFRRAKPHVTCAHHRWVAVEVRALEKLFDFA